MKMRISMFLMFFLMKFYWIRFINLKKISTLGNLFRKTSCSYFFAFILILMAINSSGSTIYKNSNGEIMSNPKSDSPFNPEF